MNDLPAANKSNIELAAKWVIILIFILMAWHFVLRQV